MAERQTMTTAEVVAKTLTEEHADFLKEAVAMVAAQLMEAEITAEIGAGRGEVSAERATHRNGYRPRLWETRVGEIELAVPRKREGLSDEVCVVVVIDLACSAGSAAGGAPGGGDRSRRASRAGRERTHHHEHHEVQAAPRVGRRAA